MSCRCLCYSGISKLYFVRFVACSTGISFKLKSAQIQHSLPRVINSCIHYCITVFIIVLLYSLLYYCIHYYITVFIIVLLYSLLY